MFLNQDKTQKMMKVFRREESSNMAEYSLASKQTNSALRKNETSPKDFTLVRFLLKILHLERILKETIEVKFISEALKL